MLEATQKHLLRAINILGGQSALARSINTKQQNVWFWLNKSGRVPAEFVLSIEQETKGQVTRSQLRPDIYPEHTSKLDINS
ncbi:MULTISPECIES: transcriptional regulator [Gammaproteobacteria]|uniref:YdaS antitoxin of YdaST toxin-antitoxin system n=1 Tax=Marinomonas pollencensis TaxID=491954 RepID=A0A3E0DR96_9GAMM|nr:helix-turn-helix domain-containing protein [Marinomonas pollencensis]REG85621.1 YdaS antitoxin of YdaST toxin-antitoxin system [Marinomonas pollencensis]